MTIKHTPGPWEIHANKKQSKTNWDVRQTGSLLYVASGASGSYRSVEESQANARLIAAAPDLLAALQDCLEQIAAGPEGQRVYYAAKKAIAKAIGESE